MIVTCPQCQYENQVETTTTTSKVVCARCATMIPLSMPTLPKVPSLLEIETPPIATANSYADASPLDLDSLFAASPSVPPPPPRAQNWEFDEVLDIPKTVAPPVTGEAALEIEEILSVSPRSATPTQETRAFTTIETNGTAMPERPANPWVSQPELAAHDQWPEEIAPSRPSVAFPQDSFQFDQSTVVMTPPRRAKSNLTKVLITLLCLVALAGVGYYLLSDLVREWMRESSTPTVAKTNTNGSGNTKPAAVPGQDQKAANNSQSSAAANSSSSQAATDQTPKLATSTIATPTPVPKPTPQVPAPAPANQTPAGHSIGQGDGSVAIQVGSYNNLAQATERANKLKSAGLDARVIKAEIPQRGTWYRVQTGRFTSEAEASRYARELRAKGVIGDFIPTGYQAQ